MLIYQFYFGNDLIKDKNNTRYSDPMETEKFYACDNCEHYKLLGHIFRSKNEDISRVYSPTNSKGLPYNINDDKECIKGYLPCPRVFCIHQIPKASDDIVEE